MSFAPYTYKKNYLMLVSVLLTFAFLSVTGTAYAQYNFAPSSLSGGTILNPTSLQFGPDGRLYVAQQNGIIKVFTVKRNGSNSYTVTATETINLINLIPNHNDDGTLNAAVTTRQVTGILVKGTASNPIIYVTSSDSRIGGSSSGDVNLDTNSGIISLLSWNGAAWTKMDLVRGLPRSEENHSNNGLQLDAQNNILFVAVGGLTNAGSPSTNFAFISEFALSAAILSINLTAIEALPTNGSGNTAYKYDLPTVDDPSRTNNINGTDQGDPFGGNNGLNQAKVVTGGPVQVYAPGFRNPYDLVITQARRMYTIDNGANQGWGGYPKNEGSAAVTNEYVTGEPGSTTATATEGVINNLDNLHYIGNVDTYVPGSFYGGHPNPIRANPAGAGLYTYNGTTGVWRNSKASPNPLPADWPPVENTNSIEGDFQMPGVEDQALLTFNTSTNGLVEYTASNFNNVLKGSLLACGYNGSIYKIGLTADGTNVTNSKSASSKLNQDIPFASGFGSTPLDITSQGDNDIFPGTVWVAVYGSDAITIYEPQDFQVCTGLYNGADDDFDKYTNADEVDNGTNPCSAASVPPDNDHDFVSDLNDTDDDNDGIADTVDAFAIDSQNGLTTNLPIKYDLLNNNPGTGFFGLGFTGLMTNKTSDYIKLYNPQNSIAGGAVGALTIPSVSGGDALGNLNSQENGFQFGVKSAIEAGPFTIQARMLGPFFNNGTPQNNQSQGIYIGTGDQDNYLKIALNANNGIGGIEVVYENSGTAASYQFQLVGGIPGSLLDLFLSVDPASGKVQPKYASNNGAITNLGTPIQLSGTLLNVLQSNLAYGVGIISTSRGATPFTATWDYIYVTNDPITVTGTWQTIVPAIGIDTAREENSYVQAGNNFYLLGGRGIKPVQAYDPINKSWVDKALPPVEMHHFQAVTMNGLIYVAGAFTGGYPHETPIPTVRIFNPESNVWLNGSAVPLARRRGSAGAAVYNNKIYLVGGIIDGHWSGWVNWFDEYDPATNTWKTLPDAPRARDHFNVEIVNDKLYVIGGRRSSGITGQVFSLTVPEVDIYNFTTGQWSTLPGTSNIPTPRAGAATASVGNEVIIIGGEASELYAHKETEALDITTNTWRRLADLQQGRHGTQAIVNNRGIYVVAGAGNQGGSPLLNSQELFNFFTPGTPGGSQILQSQLTAPTSLSFGSVPVNYDSIKTFTITNSGGTQDILISSLAITGDASFTANAPYSTPFILPVGKSIVVSVTLKTLSVGSHTAILTITHSGQGTNATINLSSEGVAPIYRINAGGPQLTNSIGTFSADAYFTPTPGQKFTTSSAIAGTTDDAMYQTERSSNTDNGTFSYAFPVSNGQYMVVLHFAEIFFTALNSRVFDVNIEGTKVLDNYDIAKKAGTFTATTETFTVNVVDGTLNIDFSALVSDGGINRPKVSAIEVLSPSAAPVTYYRDADGDGYGNATVTTTAPSPPVGYVSDKTDCNDSDPAIYPGAPELCDNKDNNCNGQTDEICNRTPIYRINAGGTQLTNSIGTFNADAYFTTTPGQTYATSSAIAATTDDAMYQTERSSIIDKGTLGYAFPVSNGQYTVVLHFAEIFFTAANNRVFDVNIEGTKVLDNFDIFKKAGAFTATTENFTVNVADGILNIDFSALAIDGGINRPKVSAIEILGAAATTVTYYRDADGDGYGNAAVTTTATSPPAGYVSDKTDCNDSDPAIYPGAPELCDGKDNNCNGTVDEGVNKNTYYQDLDNDGYGSNNSTTTACTTPPGYVTNNTDCNDGDATIYPGAPELCDNKDNNCNGTVDEGVIKNTYYQDLDNDGYGNNNSTITACTTPLGYVTNNTDCNDGDAKIYPGAPELCDGKDNNCNGTVDEGVIKNTYYQDLDNDGYGNNNSTITACTTPLGYVTNNTDCNDGDAKIYPGAPELCDGKDNNCNGQIDEICSRTPIYRINAGGPRLTNSIGTFNADAYFTPTPGKTFSTTSPIAATLDDVMYQTERNSGTDNGTFGYAFPISNGQYTVVLHFAEIFFTRLNNRVFDVSIEGTKVLDNYDIFKKAGAFTATTETFTVNVADGKLNIDFSALVSDGGINRPKVSAIEILSAAAATVRIATANSKVRVQNVLINESAIQKLNIKVFPNPANNYFNVIVQGAVTKPITLRIIDVAGRTIQSFNNLTANKSIQVGTNYRPGVYMLEGIQGLNRVMMKLIKQPK